MATFEYIDKTGNKQQVDALNADEALTGASNIAPNSGVQALFNNQTPSTPTTPQEPTVGQMFQTPTFDNSYEDALNSYRSELDFNEKDVRKNILSNYQGEIDTVKSLYSNLLSDVKRQGEGRLGESTAQQARRGLLGSDFGSAQKEKVVDYNLSKEQEVLAAQARALAGITSRANQDIQDEINAKRLAKQGGTEAYLAYLASAPERRQKRLSSIAGAFLSQGIDPTSLSEQELGGIAKQSGLSTSDIINSYLEAQKTQQAEEAKAQAELQKELSFNLSEGQDRYQYDPETGEVKLVASKAKTYAPKDGSDSDTVSYNGKKLTSAQKTAVDNLDAVEASLRSYKSLYETLVDSSGVNLTGADAGQLAGAYNALIFQIAQAAGTGALQAADREVVEAMIPNPTTLSGGFGSLVKGGKEGGKKAIDEALVIFENKRNAILGESQTEEETTKTVRERVEEAGYDYDALKTDGYTDEEILESL